MAETTKKSARKEVDKKTLMIGIVVLAAIVVLLVQHMVLTQQKKAAAEDAYQQGLEEADASTDTFILNDKITVDVATLREIVAPVSKLIACEYFYTDVGVYEKSEKLFKTNVKIPFTTNKTLYTYSGRIGAGIELNDIAYGIDNENNKISVQFPEPKIIFHEMGKEFEFYDVKKSVFSSSDFNDFETFRAGLMEEQEEKLLGKNEFWSSVKDNTEAVVKTILTASGRVGDYSIQYEW